MNIRDVHNGGYRPDSLRNGSVTDAGKVDPGVAARNGNDGPSSDPKDRVEISAGSRTTQNGVAPEELVFARKALLGIPPLSDDRVADILQRIQEGYYSQPEILKAIAERYTQELNGGF